MESIFVNRGQSVKFAKFPLFYIWHKVVKLEVDDGSHGKPLSACRLLHSITTSAQDGLQPLQLFSC